MSFDVVRFLSDYGILYWTKGNNTQNGWVNVRCVFCDDSSNHGGFNLALDYYNCWRCGKKELKEAVAKLAAVSLMEAEKIIEDYSDRFGVLRILNKEEKREKVKFVEMPGDGLENMHKRYLRNRGFDPDYLEDKYKIRGTGVVGKWKYRIIVPIFYKGKLVSFQGRDITGEQKNRYKTLSDAKSLLNPKNILYNLDNCNREWIGVVEGIFDVWRMGDDFAATLGSSITVSQINILKKYKRVYFLFDPEETAFRKAEKAAVELSALGVEAEVVDIESEKDPAELSEREVKKIREELKFEY